MYVLGHVRRVNWFSVCAGSQQESEGQSTQTTGLGSSRPQSRDVQLAGSFLVASEHLPLTLHVPLGLLYGSWSSLFTVGFLECWELVFSEHCGVFWNIASWSSLNTARCSGVLQAGLL